MQCMAPDADARQIAPVVVLTITVAMVDIQHANVFVVTTLLAGVVMTPQRCWPSCPRSMRVVFEAEVVCGNIGVLAFFVAEV